MLVTLTGEQMLQQDQHLHIPQRRHPMCLLHLDDLPGTYDQQLDEPTSRRHASWSPLIRLIARHALFPVGVDDTVIGETAAEGDCHGEEVVRDGAIGMCIGR